MPSDQVYLICREFQDLVDWDQVKIPRHRPVPHYFIFLVHFNFVILCKFHVEWIACLKPVKKDVYVNTTILHLSYQRT